MGEKNKKKNDRINIATEHLQSIDYKKYLDDSELHREKLPIIQFAKQRTSYYFEDLLAGLKPVTRGQQILSDNM